MKQYSSIAIVLFAAFFGTDIPSSIFTADYLASSLHNVTPKTASILPESSTVNLEKASWIKDRYDINTKGYCTYECSIKKDEFLHTIFNNSNVSDVTYKELISKSKGIFNVNNLQIDNKYIVLCDQSGEGKCLIYEENPVDYVVFDWRNVAQVYRGKRKVSTTIKTAAGIINSSLYATMTENEVPAALAVELTNVFAWSVDFFRLHKGDAFKIIYEEQSIDEKIVNVGNIKAAYFKHGDADYYAIAYDQNGAQGFFDEEGKSIRKAFLKAPLKYSRISSKYSRRRYHPVLKRYKAHLGTDYAASTGTPIMAVADGRIVAASYTRGNGRYVKIKHNKTYTTGYLHMSKFAKGIKSGSSVKQGQVIGYVGSTGYATGPHLCYRLWKNGRQVDPLKQKIRDSKPIVEQFMNDYMVHKDKTMRALKAIRFNTTEPMIADVPDHTKHVSAP